MTLLESARTVGTPAVEQFDDQRGSDGRFLHANVADAWAPGTETANIDKNQITPETAFLPFTRFAAENHIELNPHQTLGLSKAWGYTRNDSVLNPGGGRCNASSTSMSCGGENGIGQYKGANADAPKLYADQGQTNNGQYGRQYFAPVNDVAAVSPDNYRYLNQVQVADIGGDNSSNLRQVNYQPGKADVASILANNDATVIKERFENKLEQPVSWKTNSLDAFTEAVESEKPMVVVFGDNSSALFNKQMQELKEDKNHMMSKLSSRAVFVVGKPNEDEYARRMATHLKLTDYPTVSVIAPRTDQLTETYRMEGYFNVSDIFNDLNKALPPAKQKQNVVPQTFA